MSLAQHDYMVETFTPDRPDDSFAVSVLPWRAGGSDDLFDAKADNRIFDSVAIDAVSVTDQKPGRGFEGKRMC
jgi:hypothetical protein